MNFHGAIAQGAFYGAAAGASLGGIGQLFNPKDKVVIPVSVTIGLITGVALAAISCFGGQAAVLGAALLIAGGAPVIGALLQESRPVKGVAVAALLAIAGANVGKAIGVFVA